MDGSSGMSGGNGADESGSAGSGGYDREVGGGIRSGRGGGPAIRPDPIAAAAPARLAGPPGGTALG